MSVGKMKKALPFIGMAMAECAQAGLVILSKQAMSTGMSNLLFVFYSNSLAAIILLPFAFFSHGRQSLPPLNFSLLCGFFLDWAVVGSAFQLGVSTWCLHKTEPVFFFSVFKPFGIVIAVGAGVLFFNDTFYVGSLVGATVIVVGFYSVIWGKPKEDHTGKSGKKDGIS